MDEPVIAHGMPVPTAGEGRPFVVGIEKLGAGTAIGGLTPALLISTEPSGIPAGEAPLGDGGNVRVAVDEAPLLEVVSHVAELPSNDVPVAIPPPSKVALVPDMPDDELPAAEHVVPLPVGPIVPVGAGLRPGESSPVAPNGIPVPATGMLPERAS
jgi:hypothetical protein